MAQTRFTCTLTRADEPACQTYARVTITDSEGASARACPRHARRHHRRTSTGPTPGGLNQWERKALGLSEERSELAYGISTIRDRG